ncbi:thioredoxin-like protein [Lojkania enalia]|uniref:Thioredoxin-like protein n=1 Tax=Lojkania enalia TaxID=147567 RepID=A0A9P4MXW1_9PLEO|nr:thioredoxin-like protein [Didymosphaeria enalia]
MAPPVLEFNYDISCPYAYIASTRIQALADRASATLVWKPVLLGAIYRATSAPQGAAGSASDLFNPAKKAVTARSFQRTIKRYNIAYNPPPQHPRKTVNALRLLYAVPNEERAVLTEALFRAYWVEGRDVSSNKELLEIAKESGIASAKLLTENVIANAEARKALEAATTDTIERGAFGVPGFWVPDEVWTDFNNEKRHGRFYWGQDRMHFVEASLLALQRGGEWSAVRGLKELMPRYVKANELSKRTRLEFWYDFSSPWAFLGWTQLNKMKRMFGTQLDIVMKPMLLGALFREIGAPMFPMKAISQQKAVYSRQDHADWVRFWNSVNFQAGGPDKMIEFHWADIFPIRTPTVLRCAIVEPSCVSILYSACWEQNADVANESVLEDILNRGGFQGADLIAKASTPAIKEKLRQLTSEAVAAGICGVPCYRVFKESENKNWDDVSGVIWGQDELNVIEDIIAGCNTDTADFKTYDRQKEMETTRSGSRL